MRYAALIVVLAAAAFAGGAVINSPGLQSIRPELLRSMLWNDRDINSVDLKTTTNNEPAATAGLDPKPQTDAAQTPLAPVPSVLADVNSEVKEAVPATGDGRKQGRTRGRNEAPSTGSLPSSLLSPPSLAEPSLPRHIASSQDQNVKPASSAKAVPSRKIPTAIAPMDSTPTLLTPVPDPSPTKLQPGNFSPLRPLGSGLHRDGRDDWVILVGKMKSLGVSQFTIEGQAGGRVVFACLIPLAGRQAITQRFEAEGSDPVEAAHAALRRIALWQASREPRAAASEHVD